MILFQFYAQQFFQSAEISHHLSHPGKQMVVSLNNKYFIFLTKNCYVCIFRAVFSLQWSTTSLKTGKFLMGEHHHQEFNIKRCRWKKLTYRSKHPVTKKENKTRGFYIHTSNFKCQRCSFERIPELCWGEKVVSTYSSVKSQHVSLCTPQQRLNGELDSLRFRHIHTPKPQHGWLL